MGRHGTGIAGDPGGTDVGDCSIARDAWALLVGVSMSQRKVWLDAAQAEGLAPQQAVSLMKLSPDDPSRLGDLAKYMHCDASYATALADRLEERGFVERRVSATDRRVRELVPTAAGVAAQTRLRAAIIAPPPGLDELPQDDQIALLRIAERLAERTDPDVAARLGLARPPRLGRRDVR